MKKDFIKAALMLPAIIGAVLSLVLFLTVNANADALLPISDDVALAYHDTLAQDVYQPGEKTVDSTADLAVNEAIGVLHAGKDITIRFNADYANLSDCASYMPESAALGQGGCTYLKLTGETADAAMKRSLTVDSAFGSFRYTLADHFEAKSEYQVLSAAPATPHALIIYYRTASSVGLTNHYEALVFEEVG